MASDRRGHFSFETRRSPGAAMLQNLVRLSRHNLLVRTLVVRELKARYRGSVLGFLWSFLNPLMLMLVYALVFSFYLRSDTQSYAAFLLSGLLPWIWFASSVLEGTSSVVAGSNLVNKALFPAEVLPVVPVVANLVHFVLGLPILVLFLLFYGKSVPPLVVLLPALLLVQFLFTTALVLALSALNVFYRDLQHIVGNLMTLWFFLTPVVYEAKNVPHPFAWTLRLNPMAPLIKGYQDLFYYQELRPHFFEALGVLGAFSVVLLLGSYHLFEQFKDEFVEQV
jgi:homopolymeric O-antigen transport system permease protein